MAYHFIGPDGPTDTTYFKPVSKPNSKLISKIVSKLVSRPKPKAVSNPFLKLV